MSQNTIEKLKTTDENIRALIVAMKDADSYVEESGINENTKTYVKEYLLPLLDELGIILVNKNQLTQLENHIREEERDRIRMLFEIKPSSQSWHEAVENALSQPNNKQQKEVCQ